MDLTAESQRRLADGNRRLHIEGLLRRYPTINPSEAAEVVLFLRKGPHLEVGLLTSDDTLQGRLEAFRKDHATEFALSVKEILMVILLVSVVVLFAAALLLDSGVG